MGQTQEVFMKKTREIDQTDHFRQTVLNTPLDRSSSHLANYQVEHFNYERNIEEKRFIHQPYISSRQKRAKKIIIIIRCLEGAVDRTRHKTKKKKNHRNR